jgi:hypothetical protein
LLSRVRKLSTIFTGAASSSTSSSSSSLLEGRSPLLKADVTFLLAMFDVMLQGTTSSSIRIVSPSMGVIYAEASLVDADFMAGLLLGRFAIQTVNFLCVSAWC